MIELRVEATNHHSLAKCVRLCRHRPRESPVVANTFSSSLFLENASHLPCRQTGAVPGVVQFGGPIHDHPKSIAEQGTFHAAGVRLLLSLFPMAGPLPAEKAESLDSWQAPNTLEVVPRCSTRYDSSAAATTVVSFFPSLEFWASLQKAGCKETIKKNCSGYG